MVPGGAFERELTFIQQETWAQFLCTQIAVSPEMGLRHRIAERESQTQGHAAALGFKPQLIALSSLCFSKSRFQVYLPAGPPLNTWPCPRFGKAASLGAKGWAVFCHPLQEDLCHFLPGSPDQAEQPWDFPQRGNPVWKQPMENVAVGDSYCLSPQSSWVPG